MLSFSSSCRQKLSYHALRHITQPTAPRPGFHYPSSSVSMHLLCIIIPIVSLGSGFLELQYLSLPRCCTGAQREARRSHRPFPAFELTRTAQPHPHFQQSQSTQILASSDQDRQVTSYEAQITNWGYFVAR